MTRRKPIEISSSERIVMDIIIKYPEGLSFQEIVTLLQEEGKRSEERRVGKECL